jgi:hypothetical protein
MQQGRYIAHKFESGWEVGVIKAFDKKGPHVGKFSVKYKDDPNWWTHPLLREGYSGWRIHCGVEVTELSTNKQHTLSRKDKHWVLLGLPSRDSA